jgi:putative cardiolipin synthase
MIARAGRFVLVLVAALTLSLLVLRECSRLPSLAGRSTSTALVTSGSTKLDRVVGPLAALHAPHSGVYALVDARDAFAARMQIAHAAQRSLDVQYYIWHKDMSGTLLFDALREAAERGVRVRLLLDDNNTTDLDATLAALDAHPNIEVRLFNPFVLRRLRLLGYLTDFGRLNRRMHNKSFTGDNQVTVVGGRNVGDEYFGASEGVLFADLDVLAVGPVVAEVSSEFDRYWNSESAYPLERLVPKATEAVLQKVAADVSRVQGAKASQTYLTAIRTSPFVQQLLTRTLPLEWVPVRMVSDDPAKALGHAPDDSLVITRLKALFGTPAKRFDLVSPYFVPGETGTELFRSWASHGVAVRVLTNSLEATDVVAVHAGYARRREALLESGVTLYELRRSTGIPGRGGGMGSSGSSGSSLHAKTFAVDGSRVFVGSFNFDPRSFRLNTEMGFVISSTALAGRMQQAFEQRIPVDAYEVRLSKGRLIWIERRGKDVVIHQREPGSRMSTRALVWLLSRLPVEWLL